MRNIQETIIQHERFISEKQDLVYLLSHDLKNFAGQPQAFSQFYYRYESEEVVELAELIYQSSKHQFQYIENFIKLLKDQDESITNLPESRLFVFQSIAREVKDQLQQLLLIKKLN
jgi:signal transduction histidine kinase